MKSGLTMLRSIKSWRNATVDLLVEHKAIYSASVDDNVTIVCFLEDQRIRLLPRNMAVPD